MTAGPRAIARGFSLMFKPGIRNFVIAPLLINIAVFVLLGSWLASRWSDWITHWTSALPAWLHWLNILAWLAFALFAILMVAYGFTMLANLIASPFNGFLSERVERFYGHPPDQGRSVAVEALQGIVTEIRKAVFIAVRALLLLALTALLSFLPLINGIIPLLWLAFGGYMLALEYFDYPLSNHGQGFRQTRRWIQLNRTAALSFGITVTFLAAMPLVNLVVMPAAVIGATCLWLDRNGDDGERHA